MVCFRYFKKKRGREGVNPQKHKSSNCQYLHNFLSSNRRRAWNCVPNCAQHRVLFSKPELLHGELQDVNRQPLDLFRQERNGCFDCLESELLQPTVVFCADDKVDCFDDKRAHLRWQLLHDLSDNLECDFLRVWFQESKIYTFIERESKQKKTLATGVSPCSCL